MRHLILYFIVSNIIFENSVDSGYNDICLYGTSYVVSDILWYQRIQADIFFEVEEDTKEYSKYLQACIPAVHNSAYNDFESFQPYNSTSLQQ
jgi:hypothetical protein